DPVSVFVQLYNLVAEQHLDLAFDRLEQRLRKVASRESDETPACQLAKDPYAKSSRALSMIVNDAHLPHVIADALEVRTQSHMNADVVSETPEIDDVAASTQYRRVLDNRRRETSRFEPERKCWPRDSCARDKDCFTLHWTSRAPRRREA